MRRKVRKLLFIVLYYLGVVRLFYFLNRNKQRILVFHHIIPDKYLNDSFEQEIVCTSEHRFRWLLGIINKHLEVTLSLGKPGSALITFDDGYRAALNAAKILKVFNNKAVIFIPVNAVNGQSLWIDKIMLWFAYVPNGCYLIGDKNIMLNTQFRRQKAFSTLVDTMYLSNNYHPEKVIDELNTLYPFSDLDINESYYSYRFMGLTKDEIDSLKEDGFLFGGHSVKHDILSCLSYDDISADFRECEKEIGGLYNCSLYAYPFGHKRDVNCNVLKLINESSFTAGMMNEVTDSTNSYQVSRINVSHYDNIYEVEATLSGLTHTLKRFIRWIK